jgi:uncharacterized phage-associated protein
MLDPLIGFRSRLAAQVAAFFASENNGPIDKPKLITLIYLFERQSIATRGRPAIYDEYYSLENGPICSGALDGINLRLDKDIWSKYIHSAGGNKVVSVPRDLDELSDSDIDILAAIWTQFGWMTAGQIRNWTHLHCQEYVEVPTRQRLPISPKDIGSAVGIENPDKIEQRIQEYRSAETAMTRQLL